MKKGSLLWFVLFCFSPPIAVQVKLDTASRREREAPCMQCVQAQLPYSKQLVSPALVICFVLGTVQELWPAFFRYWYILHVLRGSPFICPLSLSPRARISLIVKQDKAAILTLKTLGRNVFTLSLSLSPAYYASPLWWTQIFFSPSSFLHACLNGWEFSSWRIKSLFTPQRNKYPPRCFWMRKVEGQCPTVLVSSLLKWSWCSTEEY